MFVERLSEEQMILFLKSNNMTYTRIEKYKTKFFVELSTGAIGPQPSIWFTDFYCNVDSYYKEAESEFNMLWRKELYYLFGKEYKIALKKEAKKISKEMTEALTK